MGGPDDRSRRSPRRDAAGDRDRRPQRRNAAGDRDRRPPHRDAAGDRSRRAPGSERPVGDQRPARGSVSGPPVDRDATIDQLERSVQRELSSLPGTLAEKVASHLVMSGRLLDEDPATALLHARRAHDLSPRIPAVREALAIAAYTAGEFKEALREARTVRRMSGDDSWLPLVADCERGLGRADRALDELTGADLARMPEEVRAECLIVMAGARQDLGQPEAALAVLDGDLLRSRRKSEWSARLRLAYADALDKAGRADEAERWIRLAVASDPTGGSGAGARLAELEGIEVVDTAEGAEDESAAIAPDED